MRSVRARSALVSSFLAVGIAVGVAAVCWPLGVRQPSSGASPANVNAAGLTIAEASELRVDAFWDPIKDSMSDFHRKWDELAKLRPAVPSKSYPGSDFRAFLPRGPAMVGDVWDLKEEGLLTFLRQFHPGATLKLHINTGDSLGAYACLRRLNDEYAEIVFRVHAEFVLRDGFFTPGQFTGSLVVDRANRRPVYFRMYLPPGPVNFDTNWRISGSGRGTMMADGKEVEVEMTHATDAGSVPRMELIGGDAELAEHVQWAAANSLDEVNAVLALRFYKFKQIEWVDFGSALALAKRAGKPLHVLAVDGTLDDESC
jgi:hypothetical protein